MAGSVAVISASGPSRWRARGQGSFLVTARLSPPTVGSGWGLRAENPNC